MLCQRALEPANGLWRCWQELVLLPGPAQHESRKLLNPKVLEGCMRRLAMVDAQEVCSGTKLGCHMAEPWQKHLAKSAVLGTKQDHPRGMALTSF